MPYRHVLAAAALALLVTDSALADQGSHLRPSARTRLTRPPELSARNMTCKDFLALEEAQRPKAVYWAEGLNAHGKVDDAAFDVASTDGMVPVLVADCRAKPQESFVDTTKLARSKADMNK